MVRKGPDWQAVNAYVDGALDAPEAAAVAVAAGSDPETAQQIAALYRLKGATHGAFPGAPPGLAEALAAADARSSTARRFRWRAGAMAAVLAAAAVVLVLGLRPREAALPGAILETARTLHADWLGADAAGMGDDAPATLMSALTHFRQLPVIPDLESARLTITRVRFADYAGGPMLQVGYRGLHGCHLSLFVFVTSDMPETMARVDIGPERAYGWQVGNLGYLLYARGMDEGMLDLIARKVETETRTHTPIDNAGRQALAARKKTAASCVA